MYSLPMFLPFISTFILLQFISVYHLLLQTLHFIICSISGLFHFSFVFPPVSIFLSLFIVSFRCHFDIITFHFSGMIISRTLVNFNIFFCRSEVLHLSYILHFFSLYLVTNFPQSFPSLAVLHIIWYFGEAFSPFLMVFIHHYQFFFKPLLYFSNIIS